MIRISEVDRAAELVSILQRSEWFTAVLRAVATVDPPDWCVGAGVLRDVVWGTRFTDGFESANVKDVDVVFFDPLDLRSERDRAVEESLRSVWPEVPWDAKNQAAVHLWYPHRFGFEVEPVGSIAEAVGTWPEFATAVAVRLDARDGLEIIAPFGLDDLLDGVWRHNPCRASVDEYRRRLESKQPHRRWPGIQVIEA
jgi:hypothetical protein